MNPTHTKPFATDPYAHQPDSEWKTERLKSDQGVLCRFLRMNEQEVYDASTTYTGREIDLFRLIMAVRFLDHALENELKDNSTTLKVASALFTVEGVAPATLLPNRNRLKRFLVKYLTTEEKVTLLNGFLFAGGHALGQAGSPSRHLMFESALNDAAFRKRNYLDDRDPKCCSTRQYPDCFCARWLPAQGDGIINGFTEQLGDKLYDMRNAVAHDAIPVFFAFTEEKPPHVAGWSMTLVDVFTREERQSFVTYVTGLHVRQILDIFLNGLRRCFQDGSGF